MGRFAKNSVLSAGTVSATEVLVDNSPVLSEANSTFDDTLYVAKNGNDSNDGMSLRTPFQTIKAAMLAAATMVATSPTRRVAVRVASGNYTEDNPVTIPRNTALMGDNLRTVFIDPVTPASDFFYLSGGSYIWGITVRNYEGVCFQYDPNPSTIPFVPVSPYIQNITSRTSPNGTPDAVCVLIDGSDDITTKNSSKAMILGFMTIFNHDGIGVKLTNRAYSQAVNIYTLFCEVGIKIESGSFMTLNGSDCSCGTYGIWADGKTEIYSGTLVGDYLQGVTQVTVDLTAPAGTNPDVGRFPRTNNGILLGPDPNLYFISTFFQPDAGTFPDRWTLNITSRTRQTYSNGDSFTGYAVSTVSASAHTMEYVGSGTNPTPEPILSSDGSTILPPALPQYGGLPVPENEIRETDGGRVNFTSTDQKGDFRIGTGLSIVRATGTIEGDDFNRSLFAIMTPYILSIEGGD
jgi:hypothetical protein